jgi:hypothetical protein
MFSVNLSYFGGKHQVEYNTRNPRIRVQLLRKNGRLGDWEFVFSYSKHNLERRFPYAEAEDLVSKLNLRKSFVFKDQGKRVDLDDIETAELVTAIQGYIKRREKVKCISLTQIILRDASDNLELAKQTMLQPNREYIKKLA